MRKYFSQLLCKRREMYAEVYSQAYSLSFAGDDYLANQKQVPSSTSFLSSNEVSLNSSDSDVDVFPSVDLIQLGCEQTPKRREHARGRSGQTTFATMGIRTVTSIEDKDEAVFDIETFLEEDGVPELSITRMKKVENFMVTPMDYHESSKSRAKTMRRPIFGKEKVSPLQQVRNKIMRSHQFKMIPEEVQGAMTSGRLIHERNEDLLNSSNFLGEDQCQDMIILRNVSSTSALYIENERSQSF